MMISLSIDINAPTMFNLPANQDQMHGWQEERIILRRSCMQRPVLTNYISSPPIETVGFTRFDLFTFQIRKH